MHAAGFTPGELDWPGTWTDRAGRDRTPSVPGHEVAGQVDVVFDVLGGDLLSRSAALVRPGGALVSIAAPPTVPPEDGRAVFFVVEPDRAGLVELELRLRDGRLRPLLGATYALDDAPAAFAPGTRGHGKPIIRVVDAHQSEGDDT